MTAEQAKEYGIVDEVISVQADHAAGAGAAAVAAART